MIASMNMMVMFAQSSRKDVENGVAQVERLIEAHKWHEAFEHLRSVEAGAQGNPANMYLATKQRYRMYARINKPHEAAECLQRMEAYAMQSKDNGIIENMLHVKAYNYSTKGDAKASRACYAQMFNRRSAGKDDAGKEACFKQMIDEATKGDNNLMKNAITALYSAWQDSVAAVRAGEELANLKADYKAAQDDIDSKATKIAVQWGTIIVLGVLLAAAVLAVVFLLLIMLRNVKTIKNLRNSLDLSEQNSAQKSVFMRNIGKQIAPSLSEIEKGNAREHIAALKNMMGDVERFVELDDTKTDIYEVENTNVADLCEQIVKEAPSGKATVTSDATRMTFPVCQDAVKELILNIIGEVMLVKDTERIVIGFKKRNLHTGQFTVTAVGMKLDEEQKQTIFTAFAKVYDLTKTTGLVLPVCSLMAHKMNGTLSIDDQFAKGTRFVVEVHG